MTAARRPFAGLAEGFYGRPWTTEQRVRAVRALGELGLDLYLWAPKNDPRHRERWWEPWDGEALRAFGRLVDEGARHGVAVAVALAPERLFGANNLRVVRSAPDEEAMAALVGRALDLAEVGVRTFAVSFDDTWATFLPAFASRAKGRAHALVAARLAGALRARDAGASVLVVPAVYSKRAGELRDGPRRYLEGLGSLGDDLPVAWTGPRIFSPWIAEDELLALERAAGLRVWIWNNAVTNDWLPLATGEPAGLRATERLSFGPVTNLAPGVVRRAAGVVLNAPREPELARVALASFAELVREGDRYDPWQAFGRALEGELGSSAALVREVFDLVAAHPLAAPWRRDAAVLHDALAALRAGAAGARGRVLGELARLESLEARLAASELPEAVRRELAPTVEKATLSASALRATLEGRGERGRLLAKRAAAVRWSTGLDDLAAPPSTRGLG